MEGCGNAIPYISIPRFNSGCRLHIITPFPILPLPSWEKILEERGTVMTISLNLPLPSVGEGRGEGE